MSNHIKVYPDDDELTLEKDDGFIVKYLLRILRSISLIIAIIHYYCINKNLGPKPLDLEKQRIKSNRIEIWYIVFMFIEIVILLIISIILYYNLPSSFIVTAILVLLFFIALFRLSDILYVFLKINFELVKPGDLTNRLSRKYILLIFNFFEVALLFSILQLSLGMCFTLNGGLPLGHTIMKYTLLNMLTLGGGEFSTNYYFIKIWLYALKIAQPLFSVLFVTMAISQILKDKKNNEDIENNEKSIKDIQEKISNK